MPWRTQTISSYKFTRPIFAMAPLQISAQTMLHRQARACLPEFYRRSLHVPRRDHSGPIVLYTSSSVVPAVRLSPLKTPSFRPEPFDIIAISRNWTGPPFPVKSTEESHDPNFLQGTASRSLRPLWSSQMPWLAVRTSCTSGIFWQNLSPTPRVLLHHPWMSQYRWLVSFHALIRPFRMHFDARNIWRRDLLYKRWASPIAQAYPLPLLKIPAA